MTKKILHAKSWRKFGEIILKKDHQGDINSILQMQFLESCSSHEKLTDFLKLHCAEFSSGDEMSLPYQKMSQFEFYRFNDFHQELKAWEQFNKLPVDILIEYAFWGQITLDAIEKDLFPIHSLAVNNKMRNGRKEVGDALKGNDSIKLDRCTRRVLRSLCNYATRNNKVVLYIDHPLARSYWKMNWINIVTNIMEHKDVLDTEVDDKIHTMKVLHEILSSEYYPSIAERLYSNSSFIAHKNIYSGLVQFIKDLPSKQKLSGNDIKALIKRIAFIMSWKALEAQEYRDNANEITSIFYTEVKS